MLRSLPTPGVSVGCGKEPAPVTLLDQGVLRPELSLPNTRRLPSTRPCGRGSGAQMHDLAGADQPEVARSTGGFIEHGWAGGGSLFRVVVGRHTPSELAAASQTLLATRARRVERAASRAHQVKADPRELVRDGFDRKHLVAMAAFAVVPATDRRMGQGEAWLPRSRPQARYRLPHLRSCRGP